MRKAAKQLAVCAVIIAVLCAVSRFAFFRDLSVYIHLGYGENHPRVTAVSSDPSVMTAGETEYVGSYAKVTVRGVSRGAADLLVLDEAGEQISFRPMKVGLLNSVYDEATGNYTGDSTVICGVAAFWLLMSAVMVWHFLRKKGSEFYDYSTIYYAGFSIFALASGAILAVIAADRIINPEDFSMLSAYIMISGAATTFMNLTAPALVFFALMMAVSNIVLLRHSGMNPKNMLGILVSLVLIGGEALGLYLYNQDFAGSEWEFRMRITLENTYSTVFVYCQCMLTGAVISALLAAKRRPAPDRDFIIIHGCWFRKDGTLPPLLRSRADAALNFWKQQKQATGKEAVFIPSGGQGPDETMPEAEAIRRYLISQGVEERLILPETESATTLENMRCSREIILQANPEGKTAFATSSYHVFRSGVWARQAGLEAEGIGARTKWWFWPNAFMRETAGLLLKRWKQELLFLLLLTAFFTALSVVLW